MDDRRTGRARSRSSRLGPIAVVMAALMAIGGGPGLAAPADRSHPQAARGVSDQIQDDPIGNMALALSYDQETIFRFVADEIAYEPYPGILRGALGTLEARAGNSVDKALLLAALLDASLIPYRFAQGPLDEAASAQLLASLSVDQATARDLAQRPLDAGLDQIATLAAEAGPVPTGAPVVTPEDDAALKAEGQERLAQAATQLSDTATMLQTALTDAGITLPADTVSLPPAEVDQHTWVQAQEGPDWQDLDPTLAGAEAGTPLTAAAETLDALPDDLRYRITFDVLAERAQGGALVTDSILQVDDFADALTGVPVVFGHVTPSGMQTLGLSLASLFGGGWLDYRPSLDFGGRVVVADDAIGFPTGDGSGGVLSADPSPGAAAGPVDGEATAEWLEVTVTPPGGEPVTARRTVFDRVAPEVRAAGTPTLESVAPVALVDLDGSGIAGYPPMQGIEAFAIATGTTSVAPILAAASDNGLGQLALAYHNLRDVMTASLVLDAGARTYLDAPNIVSIALQVAPDATVETLRDSVRFGVDIWHRSHGTLPLTDGTAAPGSPALMAGITDHLAERFALAFAGRTDLVKGATVGVGEVFEAAAAQGIPTVVLHGEVPDGLPYGAQAMSAIRGLVGAGQVVVIPAEPVSIGDVQRVGWWSVDPATGATTDSMDDGAGTEFAEYGLVVRTRLGLVRCYGALAGVVTGYLAAATSALSVMNIMSTFAPGAGAAATCLAL